MLGDRYGRLTITGAFGPDRHGNKRWVCRCDCGVDTVVTQGHLRTGHTVSCGCYQAELAAAQSATAASHRRTHGHSGRPKSPTYLAWLNMKSRCTNSNHPTWYLYGGRGITICDEWLHSFETFLRDMGERPPNPEEWNGRRAYWSIDRIDPDGDYEPGNCRWASWSEQRQNQRRVP